MGQEEQDMYYEYFIGEQKPYLLPKESKEEESKDG